MKLIDLAGIVVAIGCFVVLFAFSGWVGYSVGKAAGYEMAIDSLPKLMELERPTSCKPTSSFRTINGQVLVTLLCPDSIGPRPKDPARRHE